MMCLTANGVRLFFSQLNSKTRYGGRDIKKRIPQRRLVGVAECALIFTSYLLWRLICSLHS